ncbi:putative DNA-directed RNA polymerase II [Melia azedarach]|uniref:DNA-directed RNA polymerase II n=1 Tax=Melia azedarach TaxID=155640 RepID=A0ACC1Y9C2_MELAZ|nr:putative DNA-directed RNA polymerase II [Melia azedarach]
MSAKTGGVGGNVECLTRKVVEKESLESYRYYLSRRTVLQMLKDRGYDIPDSELSGSLTEFCSVFGDKPDVERLRLCFPLLSNPSKKMLVIYLGTEEIKTQVIRGVLGQIVNKESLHGLILILQSKMNHFARKEVQKFPAQVEIFQITDLLVNITKHILVPKHEILTVEDKQKLLKKYKVEEKQLPQMLRTDALARYYGLEKGQVLKLTYMDGIAKSLETYRCVL